MNINPMDLALQTVTPTIMVPRLGIFEKLTHYGHRFLMADNGVWLEAKNAWGHVILPLSLQNKVAMPYGTLEESIEYSFGKLPTELIEQFIANAKQNVEIECAGWIVWNKATGRARLQMLEALSASEGHIEYVCPDLGHDEALLIDIHSHGRTPSFFSRTDNRDDRHAFKISAVVGNLDKPKVSMNVRLCVLGLMLPLPNPVMALIEAREEETI